MRWLKGRFWPGARVNWYMLAFMGIEIVVYAVAVVIGVQSSRNSP